MGVTKYFMASLATFLFRSAVAEESVMAIRTVCAFGGEQNAISRFEKELGRAKMGGVRTLVLWKKNGELAGGFKQILPKLTWNLKISKSWKRMEKERHPQNNCCFGVLCVYFPGCLFYFHRQHLGKWSNFTRMVFTNGLNRNHQL